MNSSICFWFCLLIITSARAFAFDIYPEYQGISESDLQRMERPSVIDSEYQSRVATYSLPLYWEERWQTIERGFEISAGSLTNQLFMLYSRAKFSALLGENLRFHFTYFTQRDREVDQSRHILELIQRLGPFFEISAYGEPSHFKRENDIGFALIFRPIEKWENRFFYTLHDFTRTKHNDQVDRYIGAEPTSTGWTGAWRNALNSRIRAGFRSDNAIDWYRPQESRIFRYEKRIAFAEGSHSFANDSMLALRLQWDSTFKANSPTSPTSSYAEESWQTERHQARLSYCSGNENDFFSYEASLMHTMRSWLDSRAAQIVQRGELPGILARWRGPRRSMEGFDHFRLGYELTDFRTFGDLRLAAPDQKHESLEHRLHTSYEFRFQNQAQLAIAFNFDTDEWAGVPTFEGGNARFRTEF